MAKSVAALVEPAVLRWARETAGLTPVAVSRKLGLPDDRVALWESGDARPTIAQLRKLVPIYRRPLAVFFLAEPPADFDTMRDFRRLDAAARDSWSVELHDEYRRAHEQREQALELAEIDDAPPPTTWRLAGLPNNTEEIAAVLRSTVLGSSQLALPRGFATPYEHANTWINGLENSGVLVMATRGRPGVFKAEMRAFSLYFDILPVIVVNGADSIRGRLFSLLHEYAHIALRTSGLCDTITDLRPTTPNRRLEATCNAIAAAALMPRASVLEHPEVLRRRTATNSWDYEALRAAAAPYGVSAEAFLRRLLTLDQVSERFYSQQREEFLKAYEDEASRVRAGGGGDFYRTTARDLGKAYVRQVADAHRRRVIDSYTAASYLNVKVGQIERLASAAAVSEPV